MTEKSLKLYRFVLKTLVAEAEANYQERNLFVQFLLFNYPDYVQDPYVFYQVTQLAESLEVGAQVLGELSLRLEESFEQEKEFVEEPYLRASLQMMNYNNEKEKYFRHVQDYQLLKLHPLSNLIPFAFEAAKEKEGQLRNELEEEKQKIKQYLPKKKK